MLTMLINPPNTVPHDCALLNCNMSAIRKIVRYTRVVLK